MSEFHIKQIADVAEALYIADIRNTGREFMTNNQNEITETEQTKWYNEVYQPAHIDGDLFAFIGYDWYSPVAYGLIKRDDANNYWLTGIIKPEAQGKGFGRELFKHLGGFVLDNLSDSVLLDVLKTNEKAIRLYASLGYTLLNEGEDILVMEQTK